MNASRNFLVLVVTLGLLPMPAYAQSMPPWAIAAMASPVIMIVLAIMLGLLTRSWNAGLFNTMMVPIWFVLFLMAPYLAEIPIVLWILLALYIGHALLLLWLVFAQMRRRFAALRRPADGLPPSPVSPTASPRSR